MVTTVEDTDTFTNRSAVQLDNRSRQHLSFHVGCLELIHSIRIWLAAAWGSESNCKSQKFATFELVWAPQSGLDSMLVPAVVARWEYVAKYN
jgi:hypothetical protein